MLFHFIHQYHQYESANLVRKTHLIDIWIPNKHPGFVNHLLPLSPIHRIAINARIICKQNRFIIERCVMLSFYFAFSCRIIQHSSLIFKNNQIDRFQNKRIILFFRLEWKPAGFSIKIGTYMIYNIGIELDIVPTRIFYITIYRL